jgi:hypothetical protein
MRLPAVMARRQIFSVSGRQYRHLVSHRVHAELKHPERTAMSAFLPAALTGRLPFYGDINNKLKFKVQ